MILNEEDIQTFTAILKEELLPALGCTEPIAIAYGAATARQILGRQPDTVLVQSSGNIIKNVKAVVVPNSGGMKGIQASACIGIIGGNPDKELEVLEDVSDEDVEKTRAFMKRCRFEVVLLDSPASLHLRITLKAGKDSAEVEIIHQHTNIVRKARNGKILFEKEFSPFSTNRDLTDRSTLSIEKILAFADAVDFEKSGELKMLLERQIQYNTRIVQEGLQGRYGLNIGAHLLSMAREYRNEDIMLRAQAEAAAGSDARMSGCTFPVVTNSGSGNQGLTVSIPVIVHAREWKIPRERLLRSLLVSNLTAIHQKTGIGRLSAYCGVVSAAAGSGAGISYMKGGTYEQICGTITNTLATVSGLFCDGAKPSCASKISSSVGCAVMGHRLAMKGRSFEAGDGIIKENIEKTIAGVGMIASRGMVKTDEVILDVMVKED